MQIWRTHDRIVQLIIGRVTNRTRVVARVPFPGTVRLESGPIRKRQAHRVAVGALHYRSGSRLGLLCGACN